ncbi:hypothetical protein [Vibrio crassostreae]|uniref:hypothetical protein n=1 Tax=Vibrio crassostreae TaxID=246167 RepID=UPI00062F78F4|nr:hypothetical protein [Vibrio crassostreae]CAH6915853.1 hypothetical protein VCHA36P166_20386 [Vibrio chagasii]CAH7031745.1 hypothetical protein VCHA35O141_50139 [Vibrio chagasii]CAH7053213.1 hypothetical protein VCHA35O143_60097 [Vibrio chagasii]CDT17356.1 hypothetical protein VCRLGP8_1430082 [Vibrio crassostreae]
MAINLEGTALRVLTLEATNFETVTLDGVVFARKPTITTQPVGGTINDNQSHAMSVVADGLGTALTYQWFMDGGAISGATGASHTFTPAGDTTNRTFFCQVSGFGGGNTQTSTVTVTVNPSWSSTHTFNVQYSSNFYGWFYTTMGGIVPTTVGPVTMGTNYTSAVAPPNEGGAIIFATGTYPASAYIRQQSQNAEGELILSTYEGTDTPFFSDSWADGSYWYNYYRALGSKPIRLDYFASREALDENDPWDDNHPSANIDEYHKKWGVHEGQRPDLYKQPT